MEMLVANSNYSEILKNLNKNLVMERVSYVRFFYKLSIMRINLLYLHTSNVKN